MRIDHRGFFHVSRDRPLPRPPPRLPTPCRPVFRSQPTPCTQCVQRMYCTHVLHACVARTVRNRTGNTLGDCGISTYCAIDPKNEPPESIHQHSVRHCRRPPRRSSDVHPNRKTMQRRPGARARVLLPTRDRPTGPPRIKLVRSVLGGNRPAAFPGYLHAHPTEPERRSARVNCSPDVGTAVRTSSPTEGSPTEDRAQ
ncbi:hypothetical protein BDB13_6049 [Rhodococcus sp. OK302]|nr:hypothetical protein BDB13_6049 [Rhodococcus sp. OK302]